MLAHVGPEPAHAAGRRGAKATAYFKRSSISPTNSPSRSPNPGAGRRSFAPLTVGGEKWPARGTGPAGGARGRRGVAREDRSCGRRAAGARAGAAVPHVRCRAPRRSLRDVRDHRKGHALGREPARRKHPQGAAPIRRRMMSLAAATVILIVLATSLSPAFRGPTVYFAGSNNWITSALFLGVAAAIVAASSAGSARDFGGGRGIGSCTSLQACSSPYSRASRSSRSSVGRLFPKQRLRSPRGISIGPGSLSRR